MTIRLGEGVFETPEKPVDDNRGERDDRDPRIDRLTSLVEQLVEHLSLPRPRPGTVERDARGLITRIVDNRPPLTRTFSRDDDGNLVEIVEE